MAFFLMLYREGMPGVVLFSGICAVVYFVVGIRFDQVLYCRYPNTYRRVCGTVDDFAFAGGMVWVYKRNGSRFGILSWFFMVLLIAYLVSEYITPLIWYGCNGDCVWL